MAKAVVARIEGDDYQARFFWFQVCRLFEPHTKVSSVGYEVDDAKAFDDVVVSYAPPVNDDRGGVVATDYYQVKFHVSQEGTVRFESLMDPAFIGATAFFVPATPSERISKNQGSGQLSLYSGDPLGDRCK